MTAKAAQPAVPRPRAKRSSPPAPPRQAGPPPGEHSAPRPPRRPPPRFVSPHERVRHDDVEWHKAVARELSRIAEVVHGVSGNVTALLAATGPASAVTDLRARYPRQRALVRALTNEEGLGFAFAGGPLGRAGTALGDLLGRSGLAVRFLVASLRMRLAGLQLVHPEMTEDPKLARFIEAVYAHRGFETVQALRTLFKDEGGVHALSSLAPMFSEILCLKALLDRNPFNDTTAWRMATGADVPSAEPFLGVTLRLMTRQDKGPGAARPIEPEPHERAQLASRGSLLGFLRNIALLGNDGRILIQTVRGPDGVERHVVQVPGMRPGVAGNGSPASLVGAFRSLLDKTSAYSGALLAAIEQYGLPDGAEIALIGHSAGGPAAMNLAQDHGFCDRYKVTDVIAVGAPIHQKRPADPGTFVALVANQHDIVPTLDGIDAGSCFDLHPDWYLVDYTEATHQFPECHGVEHYLRDLEHLLAEPREYLDLQLAPYRGEAVRTQLYQTYEHEPRPAGYPFLAVATHRVQAGGGSVELPVTCAEGDGLIAFFPADRDLVAALARDGSATEPVGFAGRAVVALLVVDHRESSLGRHRQAALGVVVDGPWRSGALPWAALLGRADLRGIGMRVLGMAVTTAAAADAYREVWGFPAARARVDLSLGSLRARAAVADGDGGGIGFGGLLGPGAPSATRDLVLFSRLARSTMRSQVDIRGHIRMHPGAGLRLGVAGHGGGGLADQVRELGLDGARPLLCLTSRGLQARISGAVPLTA
ncbi:MAG TPA: hypothetical protein VGM10_17925 [Actinocrinis sp.]|jgi:hypothetical protein